VIRALVWSFAFSCSCVLACNPRAGCSTRGILPREIDWLYLGYSLFRGAGYALSLWDYQNLFCASLGLIIGFGAMANASSGCAGMNRREFLQCAALLVAGSAASPWALSVEQRTFLAARPDYVDSAPLQFFSAIQRAAVKSAADHVIPATDTPGAVAAGAERFVELMVADWFDEVERAAFMTGLEDLQARSQGDFAGSPSTSSWRY
jgi:hypothetical protein